MTNSLPVCLLIWMIWYNMWAGWRCLGLFLSDLEKSVEELQRNSSINHGLVTEQDVEQKSKELRMLGDTLTELKSKSCLDQWSICHVHIVQQNTLFVPVRTFLCSFIFPPSFQNYILLDRKYFCLVFLHFFNHIYCKMDLRLNEWFYPFKSHDIFKMITVSFRYATGHGLQWHILVSLLWLYSSRLIKMLFYLRSGFCFAVCCFTHNHPSHMIIIQLSIWKCLIEMREGKKEQTYQLIINMLQNVRCKKIKSILCC